jgi:hypothetical protein
MEKELEALLVPVDKLSNDILKVLKTGGKTITKREARFMVDLYYTIQDSRVALNNQVKAIDRDIKKGNIAFEPHDHLSWVLKQSEILEANVSRFLSIYALKHEMKWFFDQTLGIGPVLAAGLLAHIDIEKAPTVGHIWNYAGYNPDQKWLSKEEVKKLWAASTLKTTEAKLEALSTVLGRNPANMLWQATHKNGEPCKLTEDTAKKALCRKPFNGTLKTICWKVGDSFVKLSHRDDSYYSNLYKERKALEWQRNLAGQNAKTAADKLIKVKIGKSTDAYKWYSGQCDPKKTKDFLDQKVSLVVADCLAAQGQGLAMLPPAHIDMRARRYAVKMFLSHLHQRWREEKGLSVPQPFAIGILNHGHEIPPPQVKI